MRNIINFLMNHISDIWYGIYFFNTFFVLYFRYLLENGADVAAVNYDGELPVDIAESDKMEELLQKIIDEKG